MKHNSSPQYYQPPLPGFEALVNPGNTPPSIFPVIIVVKRDDLEQPTIVVVIVPPKRPAA